ncbi:hypothetical protein FOTG_04570 [Fusarium oxysporum f. sp. vasinfectum 25433]|uniref:Uncharacterized protein n=1 Tax=Fusarium oxysporum f. sp. vasinfectum 25433 TaxID=1089449 RepID=X0LXP3_FUSOX|nr:hypothetical protein FOTG_04570 [Fusarium oxysporum f. sp. vasinfectum 25433]
MVRRRRKNILIIKQTSNTFKTTTLHHRLYNQTKHLITQYSLSSITLIMGLIGLAICAIMSATDSKQPRSTGCCGSRKQQAYLVQQPQLIVVDLHVHETREFHEEPNNGVYELDAMNQQHVEKDAPPAYDDVVRK